MKLYKDAWLLFVVTSVIAVAATGYELLKLEKTLSAFDQVTEKTEMYIVERESEAVVRSASVFGKDNTSPVPGKYISVEGLLRDQKEYLGFIESSFGTALSDFFKEEGISASKISICEELPNSSEGAVTYRASISGRNDLDLMIMCFPEIPGKYIFALIDKTESEESASENITPPAADILTEETEMRSTQDQTEKKIKHTYDARRLKIKKLPAELKNYIDNETSLQYALYRHIFQTQNGNATSATASSYEIFEDVQQAQVTFTLSNGNTVKGTYYHKSKNWDFE